MRRTEWSYRRMTGGMAICGLVLLAGCQPEPVEDPREDPGEEVSEELREGLTPEEMRRRAEPIPQEEAQRRGMIDTTIYIEDLDVDEVGESRDPPADPGD